LFWAGVLLGLVMFGTSAIGKNSSLAPTIKTDEVRTMITIQNNSLSGVNCLLTDQELRLYDALKSDDIKGVLNESVKYGKLIDCLIKCESGYDPNIKGDHNLAFGILQFHFETFKEYSDKYGLELDYKNPVHQIVLCDLMLQENFKNLTRHWKKCSKVCE
jgi:hypothetical protein